MSRHHRITVQERVGALDVPMLDLAATIEFVWQPETGDGWNEPREGAYAELHSVKQLTYLPIAEPDLIEWAHAWLDQNHSKCWDTVHAEAF